MKNILHLIYRLSDRILKVKFYRNCTQMRSLNNTTTPARGLAIKYAYMWYGSSAVVFGLGFILSATAFPGGFDWQYTVASALASQKHNPDGYYWFSVGLGLTMVFLSPYVSALDRILCLRQVAKFAVYSIRIGLFCGLLLGAERLLFYDLSRWVYKAHEVIALFMFFGLYLGTVNILLLLMRYNKHYVFVLVAITLPLIAIGVAMLVLYLGQRDLGWVNVNWRERGVPIWLSFAFWQWLAIFSLWLGIGSLMILISKSNIVTYESHDQT